MGTHPIFESDFDCLTEMLRFACQTRLTACRFVRTTQSVYRPREPKPEPEKLVKKPEEMTLEDFCKELRKLNKETTTRLPIKEMQREDILKERRRLHTIEYANDPRHDPPSSKDEFKDFVTWTLLGGLLLLWVGLAAQVLLPSHVVSYFGVSC